MCLINAAHEHFVTQTGKKLKTALKNFMGPGGREPRDEKNKYPIKHDTAVISVEINFQYDFLFSQIM